MKLRTRLVVALVVLATVGLVIFGVVTSSLYRGSLLDQIDSQLVAAAQPQSERLRLIVRAGNGSESCATDTEATSPSEGPGGPFGTFGPPRGFDGDARLFIAGEPAACIGALPNTGPPTIPASLASTRQPVHRTIDSASGGGSWRVFATPVSGRLVQMRAQDQVVVVAVPMAGLNDSMERLIGIEIIAGAGLLVVLAVGSWLVLRRGLQPLERMAASAATITAGDLSVRVEPADDTNEVGQVGLAINTMLTGIEDAFRERDATEQRLRQFLADASHELRTPITAIQGYAELFRIGDGRQPDLPVIMRRIESESARMHTLVEDLMLLAHLDRTRPVRSDPVDLSVLAADACTDAAAVDTDRRVTLDAPAPVVVSGDADHLRQAIMNLVRNALRHTPRDAPVDVATRVEDGWATVTVRDHGPGLDEVGVAHAFDRFWQADAARVGVGAGLGLSIVAGIAAEHGGRVSVENAPDGGARFTLVLPAST